MSAISVRTGARAQAGEGAGSSPEAGDAQFLSTLLAALGLGSRPVAQGEATSSESGPAEREAVFGELDEAASRLGSRSAGAGLDARAAVKDASAGRGRPTGLGAPAQAQGLGLALGPRHSLATPAPADVPTDGAPVGSLEGTGRGQHVAMAGSYGDPLGAASGTEPVLGAAATQPSNPQAREVTVDDRDRPVESADSAELQARMAMAQPVAPTAPAPAPRAVDDPDPSLDNVDPEFREKVERVIDRMREEYGYEVTVVEGYRSPERQAHLYEQGRTRPGQIATWTRRSWHSEGLAADLMVDGSYGNRQAYARLQRVAREEGLRTLGSRDLGHVEMPKQLTVETPTEPAVVPGRRFVGVARAAAPAPVAAVARVAMPGQWVPTSPEAGEAAAPPVRAPAPGIRPGAGAQPADSVVSELPAEGLEGREGPMRTALRSEGASVLASAGPVVERAAADDGRERGAESSDETVSPEAGDASSGQRHVRQGGEARYASAPHVGDAAPSIRAATPATPVGSTAFDQLERVEQARQLAQTGRPSRVSIRLDGAGSDQLRVGLLNRAVDAELDLADPATANLVRARVDELHRALEARGLGLDALSVNGTASRAGRDGWMAAAPDVNTEVLRTLFASASGNDSGREGQGRERPAPEQNMNQHGGGNSNRSRRERQSEE